MTSSGRLIRALRLLCMAGGLVSGLIVFAAASAITVHAHAGHQHVAADAQTPVIAASNEIDATSPSDQAVDFSSLYYAPYDSIAIATASLAGGSKTTGHCACGGSCGSCSSMSCCPAILTDVGELFQNSSARASPLPCAFALHGGSVAPLPRPPNLPLIV